MVTSSGEEGDYPARRYEGKAKTLGYSYPKALVYGGYLYVSYATNKDDAQLTRVPLSNIAQNAASVGAVPANIPADGAIYNLAGQRVGADYKGIVIVNGKKYVKR